jgi:hypothetical protein
MGLHKWKAPITILLLIFFIVAIISPVLILAYESCMLKEGVYSLDNFTLYYWIGEDRAYLKLLQQCLIRFDEYLWRTRDSDGDGCLESFCVYDTGEDNALRYGDAPVYCTADTPPEGSSVVPMASMDIMSFSYSARDVLSRISGILGDGGEARWRAAAEEVAKGLKGKVITLKVKAGAQGRLYGSITSQEIAAALKEQHGVEIDKRKIECDPIRQAGEVDINVVVYTGIKAPMKVHVEGIAK